MRYLLRHCPGRAAAEGHHARGRRPEDCDLGEWTTSDSQFRVIAYASILLQLVVTALGVCGAAENGDVTAEAAARGKESCSTRPRPTVAKRRLAIRCNWVAGRRMRWASRRTRAACEAWREARDRADKRRTSRTAIGSGTAAATTTTTAPTTTLTPPAPLGPRLDEPKTRSPTEAARVGEAANPGPGAGGAGLPLRARPVDEGLHYPRAHKDGFRCIRAAGFEQEERTSAKAMGQFTLTMETVNTTGWGPLKRRLQRSQAKVLFAQETRVRAGDIGKASSWALRNGWKSMWAPAVRGKRGGASAGVAVFARDYVGIRPPPVGGHIISEGRALACVIDAPGYRPFIAVSAYGHDGKGPSAPNQRLLQDIGCRIQCQGTGWQHVIAADFNLTPEEVIGLGFVDQLGGCVVKTDSARGTCRTPTSARTLDFFCHF